MMNPILFLLVVFVTFECIIAREPPSLLPETPELIKLEVNENESFELFCPVRIKPNLSVQWSKNNEELDPMWSTSNIIIKKFLLKIHHVQKTDSGLYKCNVVNGFGSVQAQFQVNVLSNGNSTNKQPEQINDWNTESINGEAPEFLTKFDENQGEPPKIIQPEGTNVQLKCLASGKPSPEVRWRKNGKILSEDEYGITQNQILNIKDLRQSDTGNYTCEIFNTFGSINATYVLVVTEKLQFFGNDPQNKSVEINQFVQVDCRVQTNDRTTKIHWLKKLDSQQTFRPDAIVFDTEQYENVEQSKEQYYSNNIISKPLIFPSITKKQTGQYICLIQNDKATNYKKAFIHIVDNRQGIITSNENNNNNILIYVITIPLLFLGIFLFIIFLFRYYNGKKPDHDSNCNESIKSSIRQRQGYTHHNGALIPSTTSRTSNDYLADSVDSIPISRQYQHQRYGPSTSSDIASLTNSNLYYARIQAI